MSSFKKENILPGINPKVDLDYTKANGKPLFNFYTKQIIEKLSSVFHIDYADSKPWKIARFRDINSGELIEYSPIYTYGIAKPISEVGSRWGITKGVLFVIKLREDFNEKNDFDFIDKISNDYSNRLERLLTIFISDTDDFEKKIKNSTFSNSRERKVILPFVKDDFDKAHFRGVVEDKLIQFFTQRDLFGFSSPLLTNNYFYGRENIINDLVDSQLSGQMSGVFGLRKVGKTSILNAYMNRTNSDNTVSVFIDCEDPSIFKCDWNELLDRIVVLFKEELNLRFRDKTIAITDDYINSILSDDYSDKNASNTFQKNISILKELYEIDRVSLIFDEIEDLSFGLSLEQKWKDGTHYLPFWKSIRSIYQKNPDLFSIIICGVNPHVLEIQEINNTQNPLFAAIKQSWVPNFSEEETFEMVDDISKYMGLTFPISVISSFYEEFGGHPFLIRQACSKIHSLLNIDGTPRPHKIEKMYINNNKTEILEANQNHISSIMLIFKDRYPDEYEVLKLLSQNLQAQVKEKVRENVNVISHLKNYNIVEEYDGSYSIKIKSVSNFFDNKEITGLQVGFTERNQEVSKLIEDLEVNCRKFIYQVLVNKCHDKKSALSKVISNLHPDRKDKFKKMDIDEILKPTNCPLYLYELFLIIINQWDLFCDYFLEKGQDKNNQKTLINSHFTFINKVRTKPGHNNEISFDQADYKMVTGWIIDYTTLFLSGIKNS